jgi:predicted Fe-Mo cluster-binding NifX family protein
MKIAVAASAPNLDAAADPRFGRCPYFVVVDAETMEFETLENPAALQGSGAGIAAAQAVANAGAEAVIAGNVGPNAHQALTAGGLKVYAYSGGTVREAVAQWKAGKLTEAGAPTVPSHFGMGAGQKGAGAGLGLRAGMAAGPGAGKLTQQADAIEAQIQDVRRQIAELQDRTGGVS